MIRPLLMLATFAMLASCGKNHYLIQDPLKGTNNLSLGGTSAGGGGGVGIGDVDPGPLCEENPEAKACQLDPEVSKPGVVTILLALGDIAQQQIVINEESSRLIAQNAVKFASPVVNPKILVVKDFKHFGESFEDTEFIAEVLLANYKADIKYDTMEGLKDSDLAGYDLVWFNNPGYPMSDIRTFEVLKKFKGGVVLSGDDLTQGSGFKTESLVGLKSIDNGTSVACDGKTYNYDNNSGYRYRVTLSEQFLPGLADSVRNFEYGNDIDNSVLAFNDTKYQVLATANGAQGTCDLNRPVIVRYEK